MKHEGELIYLASPYSGTKEEMYSRFREVCRYALQFTRDGLVVYSPIIHNHPILNAGNLPMGWEFWEKYDRAMLFRCDELWVCKIPGWKESKGVAAEIKIAKEFKMPVQFVDDEV